MKHFFAIAFLPILMTLGFVNITPDTTVGIESSEITWNGYKVTGQHEGTINMQSGDLTMDANGALTGGTIVIDMSSIKTTDLTGEYAGKLEGHLKSDDFFGTTTFPTSTLKITKVASKGTPGDYKVSADLTIKGKTNPIKFYANITDKVATATIKIDRTEYDVRYGSGSFFDSLGDKTIYDEFDINVKLVLK